MDPVGSNVRMLTKRDNSVGGSYSAWSSDGKTIAYTDQAGGPLEIFFCEIGTGVVSQRTFLGWTNSSVAWSPDGRTIAFQHHEFGRSDGACDLILMRRDGSDMRKIFTEKRNEITGRPALRSAYSAPP